MLYPTKTACNAHRAVRGRAWTPPLRNALRPIFHDDESQQQGVSVRESQCQVQII